MPDRNYFAALDRLYKLEVTGMKLGLENIGYLLNTLGDPQEQYQTIHIAGTNGKGSTSAMIAAALQANGYKTGLFTSPHLVEFTERIRINGEKIERDYIAELFEKIWDIVEERKLTFFEVTTALAFQYFADMQCDIAVIETGLGGRLDATNVLRKPLVTVVTSIGYDHKQYLGDTLEEIAFEKAGIFKTGSPAVVNADEPLHQIFLKRANDVGSSVIFIDNNIALPIQPPFLGLHQEQNLRTVLTTLDVSGLQLDRENILDGIRRTQELTGLRARFEILQIPEASEKNITVILDAAHNPPAFELLEKYFADRHTRPIVIAGFSRDKEIDAILTIIARFASRLVAVEADNDRALNSEELCRAALAHRIEASIAADIVSALYETIANADEGDTILVTGSFYVIGDLLKQTGL